MLYKCVHALVEFDVKNSKTFHPHKEHILTGISITYMIMSPLHWLAGLVCVGGRRGGEGWYSMFLHAVYFFGGGMYEMFK